MNIAVRVEMGAEVDGHPPQVPDAVPEARRLRLTMKLLREFGHIESCNQCDHIRAFNEHKAGVAHSEVCRNRITAAMAATARGAARLEDEDLRINRAIAGRIRHAGVDRAHVPKASAAAPAEPLDVPDLVARTRGRRQPQSTPSQNSW